MIPSDTVWRLRRWFLAHDTARDNPPLLVRAIIAIGRDWGHSYLKLIVTAEWVAYLYWMTK